MEVILVIQVGSIRYFRIFDLVVG